MLVDELDIVDDSFELNEVKHSADGVMNVPIMDVYPNPQNTFDIHLNAEGEGFQVSGDDIAGAVEGVGAIVSMFQKTGIKKTIKDTCGRRPVTKKKRESTGWNACEAKVKAIASGTHPSQQPSQQEQQQTPPPPPPRRGMSTGAKVGIGLGVVALGVIGFIIYKRRQG